MLKSHLLAYCKVQSEGGINMIKKTFIKNVVATLVCLALIASVFIMLSVLQQNRELLFKKQWLELQA